MVQVDLVPYFDINSQMESQEDKIELFKIARNKVSNEDSGFVFNTYNPNTKLIAPTQLVGLFNSMAVYYPRNKNTFSPPGVNLQLGKFMASWDGGKNSTKVVWYDSVQAYEIEKIIDQLAYTHG